MPIPSRTWFQRLAPYRSAENGRAVIELLITLVPFFSSFVCSSFNTIAVTNRCSATARRMIGLAALSVF
jgi:hypothetical protein